MSSLYDSIARADSLVGVSARLPSADGLWPRRPGSQSPRTAAAGAGAFPPRPPLPVSALTADAGGPVGALPSPFDSSAALAGPLSGESLVGSDPWRGLGSLTSLNLTTMGTDPGSTPRSVPRASSAPLMHPAAAGGGGGLPPAADGGAGVGRTKRRRRNEQQQLNNKLAQQRYREKQKARTRELQDLVDELTARVLELEAAAGSGLSLIHI